MKGGAFPWITTALGVGFFIVIVATLSISDLPRYSIRLQESKSALLNWFSSAQLNLEEADYPDDDDDPAPPPLDQRFRNANSSSIEEQPIVGGKNSSFASSDELVAGFNASRPNADEEQQKIEQGRCDYYSGSWVRDESYPLFEPFVCPFTDSGFRCKENGRKDSGYLQWRWQPSGCNLPRFNAKDMLKRLRRKRLVFVGDSLGRNQWESLVCMLYQAVSNRSNVYEARNQRLISKSKPSYSIKFTDYHTQIDYYRSHFLALENNKPRGVSGKKFRCSITLDRLDRSSARWTNADVLIFNSGHWWNHNKVTNGKCLFIEGNNYTTSTSMDVLTAYEKSLRTWAKWIDAHQTKKVFFRGFAPSHFSGGDWDSGGTCDMHQQPLTDESKLDKFPNHVRIVENVLRSMKTPVTFLNITKLTLFRKDGHAAGWGRPGGNGPQDCSHWCLPGVPDTWNALLYASLVEQQ